MATLLQFDFPHAGPWGDAMVAAFDELARSIAVEPGLIWKIWTENREEGIAGGIYLFGDEASALTYKAMHTERLASFGVKGIRAKMFEVNEAMSRLTGFELA